jgi:hypothetical protein
MLRKKKIKRLKNLNNNLRSLLNKISNKNKLILKLTPPLTTTILINLINKNRINKTLLSLAVLVLEINFRLSLSRESRDSHRTLIQIRILNNNNNNKILNSRKNHNKIKRPNSKNKTLSMNNNNNNKQN